MGQLQTIELAMQVESGKLDLRQAVAAHLTHGHVHPADPKWIDIALSIITKYKKNDSLDYNVEVEGLGTKSAEQIAEDLHLDAFLCMIRGELGE